VQRRRFAASPITSHFQAVVISGEVGMGKPDPRIFAPALQKIGIAAGDIHHHRHQRASRLPGALERNKKALSQ